MAEGIFLPESNKNKLIRFLYNSDDLGWKTIHDIVGFFAGGGIELTYYPQDTNSDNAEIAFVLKRRIPEPKPQLPTISPEKQMKNLEKDIKEKSK